MNPRERARQRGSAVVEFAVVLPILMTFLFGIMEFGRIMMVSHTLNLAARSGARMAVLPGATNTVVLNAINNQLAGCGLSLDSYVLDPPDVSSAGRDQAVTVTVRVNYDSVGLVAGYFPVLNGMQLQGTVVMRKEGFS